MGCYLSKKLSHNTFYVRNVNDQGLTINPGKIEVTESDLVLHQKGKEPIRWPLRCLRRYGFDEELFSFESGRRCPTGSGIYAFRCRRAEELFNLVHEAIQNVGQQGHLRTSQTHVNGTVSVGRPISRPTSLADQHEPNSIHLSSNGRVAFVPNANDQHLYLNGTVIAQEDSAPNYINTGNERGNRQDQDDVTALIDFLHDAPAAPQPTNNDTVKYVDLDLPQSTENIFEKCKGASAMQVALDDTDVKSSDFVDGATGVSRDAVQVDDVALHYADLDVFTDMDEGAQQPTYINLGADGSIKDKNTVIDPEDMSVNASKFEQVNGNTGKKVPSRRLSVEQLYTNIGAGSFNSCPEPAAAQTPSSSANSSRPANPGILNYIEIEMNNRPDGEVTPGATGAMSTSVSYTVPDSPSKQTESYAMIDFDRTTALTMKHVSDDGEGLRKTRHNSTIN